MGDCHTIDDAESVRERARAVCFDFLIQELEIGLTFCHMALGADSDRGYQTHRANAEKAYQTALGHVQALELTYAERELYDQKEHQLRLLLTESVPDSHSNLEAKSMANEPEQQDEKRKKYQRPSRRRRAVRLS